MYCGNCGKDMGDCKFCPFCGSEAFKSKEIDEYNSFEDDEVYERSEPEQYIAYNVNKPLYKDPITYKVKKKHSAFRFTKSSIDNPPKKNKKGCGCVLVLLLIVLAIIIPVYTGFQNKKSTEESNQLSPSQKSAICTKLEELGVSEDVASQAYDLIIELNLPLWSEDDILTIENSDESDYIFAYLLLPGHNVRK